MRLATQPMAAALALAVAGPAIGETIVFEHDESIMIVRGRDLVGNAGFDFLANGDHAIQCVALDAGGTPLAVENTYADMGLVIFGELDVTAVDRVVCRRR